MTIDQMILELTGLNSMFNYGHMWVNLKENGTIGSLVSAGLIMTFGVTCICMFINVKNMYSVEGKEKGIFALNSPLFVKALVMAMFVAFYVLFSDTVLSIFSAFTDMFFKKNLIQFQSDFKYLIASISSQNDAQTPFYFPSMNVTLEVFIFSVSLTFVIVLFYIIFLFSPAFIIIGLALGPVIVPVSLYSNKIGIKWVLYLLAAGLLPMFVGIGLEIINSMGYLKLIAVSGLEGKLIQSIYLSTCIIIFTSAIPSTVAFLFGVSPLATISAVPAFLSMCIGLVSVSTNITVNMLLQIASRFKKGKK